MNDVVQHFCASVYLYCCLSNQAFEKKGPLPIDFSCNVHGTKLTIGYFREIAISFNEYCIPFNRLNMMHLFTPYNWRPIVRFNFVKAALCPTNQNKHTHTHSRRSVWIWSEHYWTNENWIFIIWSSMVNGCTATCLGCLNVLFTYQFHIVIHMVILLFFWPKNTFAINQPLDTNYVLIHKALLNNSSPFPKSLAHGE